MTLIDLSHPLVHGQQTFPWDPKLSIIPHGNTKTLRYNITQLSMGTHQGTHLDAMYHFIDDGKTLDQMPLDWFYGPARVLRIPKEPNGDITVLAHEWQGKPLNAPNDAVVHPDDVELPDLSLFRLPDRALEAVTDRADHEWLVRRDRQRCHLARPSRDRPADHAIRRVG